LGWYEATEEEGTACSEQMSSIDQWSLNRREADSDGD
jgi:hypothetical protein